VTYHALICSANIALPKFENARLELQKERHEVSDRVTRTASF